MRWLLAVAALAAVHAQPAFWPQTGGGRFRAGVWPPSKILGNVGDEGEAVDTTPALPLSKPLPPMAGASERAGLRGLPWPVTSVGSLEFQVPQVFKLIKTAPAVVDGLGQVVVATPAGTLYGLPNPDLNGASWVAQAPGLPPYNGWIEAGSDNETANSCCYDLLLDQGNNIYSIIIERNLLAGRVYAYQRGGQIPKWPGLPFADLQSDLQLLELYHVSSLEVGASRAIYVPTFSLLTKEGMAIVNTDTGATTKISIDAELPPPSPYIGYGSATGNAFIDSTNGVAVMASHGDPKGGAAVQGWNMGPSPLWSSTKSDFIASITQSNPTVDPWKRYIYFIGLSDPISPVAFYCVQGSGAQRGQSCPGFTDRGVPVLNTWPSQTTSPNFGVQWVYAGSLVPAGSPPSSVARLLFSFTLSGNYDINAPTGCLMALSPSNGALLDSFCIVRDPAGVYGVDNFLATAPIVAIDARGPGKHTALVATFDMVIYAFDPNNLAAGPLYVANPLAAGTSKSVATDFMSMTSGGSLLISAWDDNANTWAAFAVPGVLNIAPLTPTPVPPPPAPTAAGLSGGGKAAIAIVVIGLAAATGAFLWFGGIAKMQAAFSSYSRVGGRGGFSSSSTGFSSSSYSKATAPTAGAYSSIPRTYN